MELQASQIAVFLGLSALIAAVTYWYCRDARHSEDGEQEYFLAGGSLKWYFVAGSITLTNLSTDQLVGMNGNQMALLAWWSLPLWLAFACSVFSSFQYIINITAQQQQSFWKGAITINISAP